MNNIIIKGTYLDRMTDDEFFQFCQENQDLRIERNENLEIIFMTPTGSISGYYNNEVSRQLANWNVEKKLGKTFDSSTGFTLSDRSVRSPDASWLSNHQWQQLSQNQKEKFAPVCPEFVIELRSSSDEIEDLQEKMNMWIHNGCQLGWLIDFQEQATYIYRADGTAEKVTGFDRKLSGEDILPGFELDLSEL